MKQSKYPFNLLDKCHIEFDESQPYEVFEIEARSFLNYKRLDLFAILLYIDHTAKGIDTSYAREVYKERTRAVTGFKFKEQGNDSKDTFNKFLETLDSLIEIFSSGSFDPNISIIPVDKNNFLLDGAHRIACAAYFNKSVTVVRFTTLDTGFNANYQWLEERFIPTESLDAMALEYCKYKQNIYMFVFWPKSFRDSRNIEEAYNLIERKTNVVYRKKTKLNYTATRNLILQIYSHMDWIGTIEDQHNNTYGKANEVYDSCEKFEFILVESDSFEAVSNLKEEIRDMLKIDLASVHSTDNWYETHQIANLVLNQNSTHHLETSEPDKFKKSFKLIQDYKKLFKNTSYDPNDYILDASIVLSAYGIREARDLDYLTANKDDDLSRKISNNQELIENHAEFSQYYNCAIEDLIYNPANYFVFSDMKFVSLENLYQYKIKRAEKKDLIDARLIKMYRSNEKRSLQYHILKFKNDFNRLMQIARIESIITLMNILKKIGLYNILRKIYRFLIK